jgi:hypothetical protein
MVLRSELTCRNCAGLLYSRNFIVPNYIPTWLGTTPSIIDFENFIVYVIIYRLSKLFGGNKCRLMGGKFSK